MCVYQLFIQEVSSGLTFDPTPPPHITSEHLMSWAAGLKCSNWDRTGPSTTFTGAADSARGSETKPAPVLKFLLPVPAGETPRKHGGVLRTPPARGRLAAAAILNHFVNEVTDTCNYMITR